MTTGGPSRERAGPWLDEEQMQAWLGLVGVIERLPQALDRQLREDAGIHHVYYQILAMVSQAPDATIGLTDLARKASTSLSRLSHAVTALERRGWLVRESAGCGRRAQVARLTPAGRAMLEGTAPGHVAEVRRLVFDRLSDDQVVALRDIMLTVLDGLPCPTRTSSP